MSNESSSAVAEKPKAEKQQGTLPPGCFVQMVDERWFRCSDVNVELSSEGATKVGLLLERVAYDSRNGVRDGECKTFTVRQLYQDGSPSVDYINRDEVAGLFRGWAKHLAWDEQQQRGKWKVLSDGLDEFERQYKRFQQESRERRELQEQAVRRERETMFVPQQGLIQN